MVDSDASLAIRADAISKSFGGAHALDGASLELKRGRIHALLGGNGSGKSTMIKILAGVYQADAGRIVIGDHEYDAAAFSSADAKEAGLRFVHQQESTFNEMTVAENLALGYGFEASLGWHVRWRQQHSQARKVLERFHIDIDPRSPLSRCGTATQMMIAIARALQDVEEGDERVLVLDEPTAALPPSEVHILLDALRRYAKEGHTILFVTHRLDEVVQAADQVTALRDGRVAGTLDADKLDHDSLVALIVGRKTQAALEDRSQRTKQDKAVLECKDLAGGAVRNATFEVAGGELVALAGLLGSGRSSVLRLINGDLARENGQMRFLGTPHSFAGPRQAREAGVAYVPEDRLASAAFLELSVRENMGITAVKDYFQAGFLRNRRDRRDALSLMERYRVKASSPDAPLATLSGGNQQKAILARWLRLNPRLLLLDEPTQGVDVGARAEIWQLIREALAGGAAALVVLSDFEELVSVCDRVLILHKGQIAGGMSCSGLSEVTLEHAVLSVNDTSRAGSTT